jgi:hypothetical protein
MTSTFKHIDYIAVKNLKQGDVNAFDNQPFSLRVRGDLRQPNP